MKQNVFKRFSMYIIGLFVMTIGIALSIKSSLGVSPVSSIPYAINRISLQKFTTEITTGQATIIFHCFLVLLQIILLRKNYKIRNLLQIVVGIVFGYFTDICIAGVNLFLPTPENIVVRLCMMLLSTAFVAFGIFLYMPPQIMPLAGEGAMQAVSDITGIAFPKVKVGFDISMVVISLVSCLALIKSFGSVGVGTIIAAVLVGTELGFVTKWFGKQRDKWLGRAEEQTAETAAEKASNHYVVTISREYGSGGKEIGKRLAERLGVPYYDSDLIHKAAEESEISAQLIEKSEQSVKNPAARNVYYWYAQSGSEKDLPVIEQIYHAQEKIIKELAQKESCVIIGRLANFILKDKCSCINLFIGADMETKIKRVTLRDNLDEKEAKAKIQKVEKERANHCTYFTHEQWGNVKNYDFYIKSDILGIDRTVELIEGIVKERMGG